MKRLHRITAPHFCAGFVEGGAYAPIIAYMRKWSLDRVRQYCQSKRWHIEEVALKSTSIIYCDGASRKDGRGGWGATILYDDWWYDICGGEHDTTNNRMEMTAAIEALNWLPLASAVTVYSDSKYVIDGMNEYVEMWRLCGWRTGGNKPVKNLDLWHELIRVAARHETSFEWVRGHSGVEGNEIADSLAGRGIPPKHDGNGHGESHVIGSGKMLAGRLRRTPRG